MDFDAAMAGPIGHPALARCTLDGTLRTSTRNWCSLLCSTRRASDDGRHPQDRALQRRRDAADGGDCTSCTRLVQWTPRVPASPRIARVAPHTIHTHTITQSPPRQPSRRRVARLGRSGSAEQRASGGASEMRPAGSGFDRVLAGLTDLAAAGSRAGLADAGRGRRGPNSIAGTPKGGLAVGWPRADSGGEGSRGAEASRLLRASTGGGAQGRVRALVADHPRRRWGTQQRRGGRGTRRGPTATTDGGDRRRRRRRRRPHTGLFFQREGPGSEPGNSLLRPD